MQIPLKEMFQNAAKNPEVRKLAKAVAGKALKKGSAAARKRAGSSDLAGMAIDFAEGKASEALDKHLGSDRSSMTDELTVNQLDPVPDLSPGLPRDSWSLGRPNENSLSLYCIPK